MALAAYETLTQALLQAPSSPIPLIATATLDSYINIARNQVAADGECVRYPAVLGTTASTQSYYFSQIPVSGLAGVQSVIAVRSAQIGISPVYIISWERFSRYYLNSGQAGTPLVCAQQGQGTAGTLFFSPIPTGPFAVVLDTVCLPITLTTDSTPEAIPLLWTDAVPFYAAWLAMQSLQRQADAQMMLERYTALMRRGRQLATSSELPEQLPGGIGAQLAAAHQSLGAPPPAAPR